MKNTSEVSYIIGINIHRGPHGILGLSQETYINKILERFRMKDCSPIIAHIVNGDQFSLNQCPKNDLEQQSMKNISYASAVGSFIYAQICTIPDIVYIVRVLVRHQSNPCMNH